MYAVEFSHRSGRDLVNMAKQRTNIIPIIEDARHPAKYRMLVGMVDVIFSDVAQPDQVWILYSFKFSGYFPLNESYINIFCAVYFHNLVILPSMYLLKFRGFLDTYVISLTFSLLYFLRR